MTRALRPARRVAITGLGVVSPLGLGVDANWAGLCAGKSGIRRITKFECEDYPARIAGEVDFEPLDYLEKKDLRRMDAFIQYAMAAATMAMEDSKLTIDDSNAARVGCIVGVGIGGLQTIEDTHNAYIESRLKRLSPFFIPKLIGNLAPGHISMRFGARGINYAPTSACASGAHGVGDGFRQIRDGYLDAAICGGAEAAITALGVAGFGIMRALSTRNDEPERASRPFDLGRDGFVMGEGAGILILEEWEAAKARGAHIQGEVIGYGASGDAYHITKPAPEGRGAAECMRLALDDADIAPSDVDYINAHGTSTQFNDSNETLAIKDVFGEHAKKLAVSSTKSMTGHLLGAAGGVESVFTTLALREQTLPPTINQEESDPACDLDYVPNEARAVDVKIAISNSFGFGGTNACLVFQRADRNGAEAGAL
ncbi:MAG: beta-ketoacyl-ACP synthase II [Candidatus Binatia bacterium]|nr:beta-ketoacyl-ACP synthase II [Candidatus Binatia bacterium]